MSNGTQKIAILGGGPAGLSAAVTLANSQPETGGTRHIELFEATGRLGGRVATFVDRPSGVTLDTCQHVLMGCCTATLDFFRTLGLMNRFTVYDRYHFFDATGRRHDFGAAHLLPAPLHLLPGFWRLKYLTRTDRLRIIRSLRRLEKLAPEACTGRTVGDWLRHEGHSPDACRRFWAVVLTSALSETLQRASLAATRQVFVDGFLRSKAAYQLWVPNEPLGTLLDQSVGTWLENRGVTIHRNSPVRRLVVENQTARAIETTDGRLHSFDQIITAIPSHRLSRLLDASSVTCDKIARSDKLEYVPITAIHLWFDRPVSTLPHAVLVDQRGNWMFRPPWAEPTYAQLVVSESRSMLGLTHEARNVIVHQLANELIQTVADKSQPAPQLLRHYTITHQRAVFSITPDSDAYRPTSKTPIQNLHLAGDWTATGWPATIEGAIRSFW